MNGLYKRDKEAEKSAKKYSIIHWQTGEPKEAGYYIVTTHEYTVRVAVYSPFFKGWYINRVSVEGIIAWCKLSDIKPCVIHQQESDDWTKFNQDEMVR